MHENGSINTHNIFMHLGHAFPPIIPDIFFQFTAHLAIIIYCLQSIINFAAGKNKTILFAMRNNCLEFCLPARQVYCYLLPYAFGTCFKGASWAQK